MNNAFRRSIGHNLQKYSKTLSVCKRGISDRSFRLANIGDLAIAQQYKDRVSAEHFMSFQHTARVLTRDASKQVLIDLSHEQGYRRGHIPGALNLPIEKFDFCKAIDTYGGITQDEVYAAFKSLGVNNDTSEIVLYDNSGLLACRLWFVLRYYGFRNVRILNGGWRAWLRAGMPVDEKDHLPSIHDVNKSLDLKPKRTRLMTKPTQMVFDHQNKTSIYIDTRKPEAYSKYHIPRAVNLPSRLFMQDAQFYAVKPVRDQLDEKGIDIESGGQSLILYSNTGLSAAVGYFSIAMAGYERLSVYDAGIHNWISNFDTSIPPDVADHLQY